MRFDQPALLWLIPLVVAVMGAFLFWAWRVRQRLVAQFVQSRLLAVLTVGVSQKRMRIRMFLLLGAVAMMLLCLARPQYGFEWEEARQHGLDIVVAIDLSRSMLAADVAPNRLARAKLAAHDLAAQAKSDRLALVVFSGSAFLQCPLTLDDAAFLQNVDALEIGLISDGGTAIAEAIRASMKAYEKENDNHKILVLLTDGEDQESGAVAAAEEAARQGMRIFTVGVGTPGGELIRVPDGKGGLSFLKDEDGNVVKSRLNETMLKEIAEKSGGFYMPLRGARPIETLYERGLAPLPKSDNSSKLVRLYHEVYQWPLALALALLVTEMFLPHRKRFVPKPATPPTPSFFEGGKAALLFLCVAGAIPARGSVTTAFKDYQEGKYPESLKEYDRLSEKRTNDFRLHYNAGTAAYQAGHDDAARRHLNESILSPDPQLQENSYYNLANSLFKEGEPLSERDQKMQLWEQSLKGYESALKLNPKDQDAKNNLAYVRQQVEKLKQEPPKSDKKDSKDKDQKDQKDKKDDKDKKDPKDQKDQDKSKQDKSQDKNQQQQKGDQNKGDKDQSGKNQKPPEDKRQAQAPKPGDKKGGPDEEEMAAAGQMTPQEAQHFLDSQKEGDRTLVFKPETPPPSNSRAARRQW